MRVESFWRVGSLQGQLWWDCLALLRARLSFVIMNLQSSRSAWLCDLFPTAFSCVGTGTEKAENCFTRFGVLPRGRDGEDT